MRDISLFKTTSKAGYFHSEHANQFLLTHPLFHHVLTLHKEGVDIREWLNAIPGDTIDIDGYGRAGKDELDYYYRKYLLLAGNGYFSPTDSKEEWNGRYSGFEIKSALANTSQISYEVTDSCNLSCDYCAYGKLYKNYDHRNNGNLSFERARNLFDYLLELFNSPMNRTFGRTIRVGFYGGEPLLNFPFIKQMVEYVKSLGPQRVRFNFGMTTNAILLGKYMDFIVENDFNLLISLDGNKENNAYRLFPNGRSSHGAVFKNAMMLKEKHPEYFEKQVQFNSVLHRKNSVAGIHSYIKTHFNKNPMVAEISSSGIAPRMRQAFKQTYRNLQESLDEAENAEQIKQDIFSSLTESRELTDTLIHYSGYFHLGYNDLLFGNDLTKRVPTGTCAPFARKVFVLANGKLLPCEQIGHQFGMGAVDEENVRLDVDLIARQMNAYVDKLRGKCRHCRAAKSCNRCIFELDLEEKQPACGGFCNEKNFSSHLSNQISYLETHPNEYSKAMESLVIT